MSTNSFTKIAPAGLGVLLGSGCTTGSSVSPSERGEAPSQTPGVVVAPAPSTRNGRIQSIGDYLSRVCPACADCLDGSSRLSEGTDFLWSPDGTRVAVSDSDQVLELSADGGSVLTRHPFECSTMRITSCHSLIWPARRS